MESRVSLIRPLIALWLLASLGWASGLSIQDQRLSSDRLEVILNGSITSADYRTFYLSGEDGLFRRVIDVKADYPQRFFNVTGTAPVGVRIGQFDPRTARIVLYHPRAFNISVKTDQNRLIVDIDAGNLPVYTPEGARSSRTSAPAPTPAPQFERYQPTVVIDPGHGGRDSGASYGGVREKDVVLKVSKLVERRLKERGMKVVMTRSSDRHVPLEDRTTIANRANADVFVSIHANAHPMNTRLEGLETYFLSPARSDRAKEVAALENSVVMDQMTAFSQETFLNLLNRELVVASNKLAIDVQRGMLLSVREEFETVKDNGVREGPFWVLVGAQMPAVLVELGYLTNSADRRRLVNRSYQERAAIGISDGIEDFILNQMGGR